MQNIKITFKSYDNYYTGIAVNKIYEILHFLSNNNQFPLTAKLLYARKKIKKITVLKSPHIDKKAREQFEIRRYKKTLFLNIPDSQKKLTVILLLLEIIKDLQLIGIETQLDINFKGYLY